jgi:ribosome-binding protein aMBF1 (putative translation factor)
MERVLMARLAKPLFNYQIEQPSIFYATYGVRTQHGVLNLTPSKKCEHCDSLKSENKKLKKMIELLQQEVDAFQLKNLTKEKAVPLVDVYNSVVSSPEDLKEWALAWKEQKAEWQNLVKTKKMSKIKYYRLVRGLDQKQMADKLKMKQPNIARIEKVGHTPHVKTLKKIADILSVTLEDLIEH